MKPYNINIEDIDSIKEEDFQYIVGNLLSAKYPNYHEVDVWLNQEIIKIVVSYQKEFSISFCKDVKICSDG